MSFQLHLLDAGGQYEPGLAHDLCSTASDAAARAVDDLGLDGADVVLCDYTGYQDIETGLGGYCPNELLVFIAIDPLNPALGKSWPEVLPSTVAHELHHASRYRGPGYGWTLRESIVSEGLATAYELGVTGRMPPHGLRYSDARDQHDLEFWWQKARENFDRTDQHPRWFFGEQDVPRWMGYRLGLEASRRYCTAHGTTAREAAHVPATDVVQCWR